MEVKRGKRFREACTQLESGQLYPLRDALDLVKRMASVHFDETVEIAVSLGIDTKRSDQMIRGAIVLPNGTGRAVRVLVLTKGQKEEEAREAGADYVGHQEFIEKIQGGWTDIDAVVATPDVMSDVGKLGRILGPRGLMPNPKTGSVTFDVAKAVKDLRRGRIEYRADKGGIVHAPLGKVSFGTDQLVENAHTFLGEVIRSKPAAAKGQYLRRIHVSSTMGPSVRVDVQEVLGSFR
ncbi:50S ribosomal protein L1 [candidate division TA06 bacterium DG_24]|uniref:Large ribosomal subunit protein uL1 n=3 Tax=Bacteria division TA06 TaxID=1156500 RepID=A0A0S8JF75_UNCT6|nr:MAG: 50S ribosomal protein L1 [candidate division TA06 bacterium DG_24]KPK68742.1 MAG: 50S ribosomal protein L1 [candidate division TA06 bacterium SM23_40]KPL08367.1 MAG: 50S ribosomal protein L1 [candidate division TA06 bacterium SM1_40]